MIALVTALIKIYDKEDNPIKIEDRFNEFLNILETKLPIYLFISKEYIYLIDSIDVSKKQNLFVYQIELEDTWTYKTYEYIKSFSHINLPYFKNHKKDTERYILTMISKLEFVQKVIEDHNNYEYYSWIDFNLFHVIKDKNKGIDKLVLLKELKDEKGVLVAGCHRKGENFENILNCINWRFCGGTLLGDKESLLKLCNLNKELFPEFLNRHKTLVWEVNLWAYYEYYYPFEKHNIIWFKGDHDETIIYTDSCQYD